jgi:hypothetical protein
MLLSPGAPTTGVTVTAGPRAGPGPADPGRGPATLIFSLVAGGHGSAASAGVTVAGRAALSFNCKFRWARPGRDRSHGHGHGTVGPGSGVTVGCAGSRR